MPASFQLVLISSGSPAMYPKMDPMRMSGGFGGIGTQRGMGGRAERSPSLKAGRDLSIAASGKAKPSRMLDQLPEVLALLRPRRGLLAIGLVLMAINRVSGLMLPASQKYLF